MRAAKGSCHVEPKKYLLNYNQYEWKKYQSEYSTEHTPCVSDESSHSGNILSQE